jgi:hypothetical protein
MSSEVLQAKVDRVSLTIGASVWITGVLATITFHPPWLIGAMLTLTILSVGIVFLSERLFKREVDATASRVLYRLLWNPHSDELSDILPKVGPREYSIGLLTRLGRDFCKIENPNCCDCPAFNLCNFARLAGH